MSSSPPHNPTVAGPTPAWQTQKQVVFALFLRELKSRFGGYRLGYFWAIGEPVAFIVVLSALRLAFGRGDIAGISFPLFFASGIIPFLFWQSTVTGSLSAVTANAALLNYRRVKPADTVVTRWLVEMLISSATGLIILVGMSQVLDPFRLNDLLGLLAAVGLLVLFTLGCSLLTGVVGPLYRESQKIIPIVLRPLLFVSGVIFPIGAVPPSYREWLLWNPLVHALELIRRSLFQSYTSQEGSYAYLSLCTLVALFLGLAVYRRNRLRLATSGETS